MHLTNTRNIFSFFDELRKSGQNAAIDLEHLQEDIPDEEIVRRMAILKQLLKTVPQRLLAFLFLTATGCVQPVKIEPPAGIYLLWP